LLGFGVFFFVLGAPDGRIDGGLNTSLNEEGFGGGKKLVPLSLLAKSDAT